jgi:predicted benzoate:H+ symporter BenE
MNTLLLMLAAAFMVAVAGLALATAAMFGFADDRYEDGRWSSSRRAAFQRTTAVIAFAIAVFLLGLVGLLAEYIGNR